MQAPEIASPRGNLGLAPIHRKPAPEGGARGDDGLKDPPPQRRLVRKVAENPTGDSVVTETP